MTTPFSKPHDTSANKVFRLHTDKVVLLQRTMHYRKPPRKTSAENAKTSILTVLYNGRRGLETLQVLWRGLVLMSGWF